MSKDPLSNKQSSPRIAVAGAGAIGCTLAAILAHAGQAVSLLARGSTLQAIQSQGIELRRQAETYQVPVTVSDDAHTLGSQDIVFLCAKSHDLVGLAQAATPLIGPETLIVPMVNGVPWWYFERLPGQDGRRVKSVDPEGRLRALLPSAQVVGVVQFMTAERVGPGSVVSNTPALLILGEIDHTESQRVQDIVDVLNASGIESRHSAQIRDPLWMKIIANLTTNPLSVITGATLNTMYGDPRLLPITRKILFEGLTLAAAHGARIPLDPDTIIKETIAMGAVRTSMLQDYEHGNPLELAAIGDAVLELADAIHLPMPTARDVIAMAHYRGTSQRR
ncbi:2-dehydropantoate 2-reductase [Pusillimonas sp. CC-YST705]|uniref:2-dehydropantoate 2-reductase n=1 Tax=Mesopusillimonas faecipullorum TaxID=2755040 RepID=A0ABS8CDN2_9BURK|nr:2-dehydropantoate 2-reductase [Mesopusillimonas faecipullorum]MCB5364136.1 2-dehydropantoate 2-reductase [Mesopusillimonas faecipullorum]